MEKTKEMVLLALLVALKVVMVRYVSFRPPTSLGIRISFGFVPATLCAMMFGPYKAAIVAFLADFIGAILTGDGYFIGFGISEILYGLSYGFFLYGHEKGYFRILICLLLQTIIIDLGLGTLWIYILTENPLWTIFARRIATACVMLPVELFGIRYTWELIGKPLMKSQKNSF